MSAKMNVLLLKGKKTPPYASARRDKEVLCINFAAPKMKTPASGLMKK